MAPLLLPKGGSFAGFGVLGGVATSRLLKNSMAADGWA